MPQYVFPGYLSPCFVVPSRFPRKYSKKKGYNSLPFLLIFLFPLAIEQLRREWSDDNVSTKNDTATLSTKGDVISDDAEDVCQALQHCILARSTTPYGFVREMEEWALAPTNFHEAVGSKDTAHLESQYPFGYRVMTRQGWEDKGGLGPHGSGIPSPLDGETLALAYRDPETSTGLGYATKASTKVTENDTFTQATNKRINMVADPASTAWHKYAEDPFAGDLAARSNYVYDETSVPRRAVLSRSLPTETDGNVNIIVQGQWIIEDTWKDTSNHLSDPDSKKDVSEEIPIIKSETIITEPWNFAGSNTSFNGW